MTFLYSLISLSEGHTYQLLISFITNSCSWRLFLYSSLLVKATKFDIYIIFFSSIFLAMLAGYGRVFTALYSLPQEVITLSQNMNKF